MFSFIFDEIKTQQNLILDKYTEIWIGYVDLGDIDLNYRSFQDVNDLETHAIVYHIRGIASDLKFSLDYFATKGVTADHIMPAFSEAVTILELTCKLQLQLLVMELRQIESLIDCMSKWVTLMIVVLCTVQLIFIHQVNTFGFLLTYFEMKNEKWK